jgi:hypothetical protein
MFSASSTGAHSPQDLDVEKDHVSKGQSIRRLFRRLVLLPVVILAKYHILGPKCPLGP